MDSPLGINPQALLMKTVQDLQECVQELKREFSELGNVPISDDSQNLQRFCAKLEFLLQAGLKTRSSLLGGKKNYWNYFCDCLASNKGLNDGIRFVKTVAELKTNLGKGRAFIRFCLVQRRLADSLQQCVYNSRVTSDWFHPMAIWVQPRAISPLINVLYDLNDLQFDLSPHGYDLDASWPTFARKTFGGSGNFNWAPPSRSTSISSLASLPQSDSFGLGSSLSSHTEPELERIKAELNETENEKLHLQVKLETLEDERRNWLKKTKELEEQLTAIKEEKVALEIQCARSDSEMKALEEKHKGSEAVLQERLRSTENALKEAREHLEAPGSPGAAADPKSAVSIATANLQSMDQKMRLVTLQKELAASKLELKNASLQLQMKVKVDEGKTKLIETLEARLTRSENSKKELLDKVESFFEKHEREEQGHSDILEQMRHLKVIMVEKEKANESLKKINQELRNMLKDLEDKSRKISALAKEKVLKYVDQNKQLQEDLVTLQKVVAEKDLLINGAQGVDIDSKVKEAIEEKHKLVEDNQGLKLEVESLKNSLQEVNEELKDLQTRQELMTPLTSGAQPGDNPIAKMKSLQEKAAQGQDSRDGATSRFISSSDELQQLREEKEDLEAQLVDLKKKYCEQEEEIGALSQKVAEKETCIKNLELELANTRTVLTTVENGLDGQVNQVSEEKGASKLLTKLVKFLDDHKHLQIELQAAEAAHLQLKGTASALGQKVEELESDKKSLSLQLAELKTLVSRTEVMNADLEARIEKHDHNLKEKVALIEKLEIKVKDMEEGQNELKKISTELEVKLEESGKQLKEVELQKTVALGQVDDLRNNLDHLTSEDDKSKDEFQEMINESLALKEKFHRSSAEISELKTQIDVLNSSKSDLHLALQAKDNELLKVSEVLAELEVTFAQSLEEKIMSVKKRLSEERESRKALEDQISEMKQKNEKNVAQVKSIEENQTKKEEKHKAEMKELKDRLESVIRDYEIAKQQQKDQNLNQTEEIATLQKERESIISERDNFKEEKVKLDEELCDLKQLNENVISEKEMYKEEAERLKEKTEELAGLRIDLEEQVRNLEERIRSVISEVEALTVEKNNLQQEYDEILQECEKSKGAADQAAFKLEGALKSQKEREKTISDLEETIHEMENDARNYKLEIDNFKTEVSELKQNVSVLEAENNILSENLTRSNSDMSEKYSSLADDKAKLLEKLSKVTEENRALNQLIESLKQEKSDARDYGDKFERKLKKREGELVTLKEELEGVKLRQDEREEDFAKRMDDLERSKDALEKEVSALQFQLSAEQMQQTNSSADLKELMEKLAYQEGLVDALEQELNDVKHDREREEERRWKELDEIDAALKDFAFTEDINVVRKHRNILITELEELRRSIQGKEEECHILSSELTRTTKMLEEEKALALKIKNESLELEERLTKELQHTKTNMESLREDYSKVKGHLIKIVKDKAVLWQQKDTLEDVRKLFLNAKWMDSGSVRNCLECKAEFSLLLRKHHCRKCGRIFCHACSNNFIDVPYSSKKERVCNDCIQAMSHLETSALSLEDIDSSSELHQEDETQPIASRDYTRSPAVGSPQAIGGATGLLASLLGTIGLASGETATGASTSAVATVSVAPSDIPTPVSTSTPCKVLSGSLRTAPGSLENKDKPEADSHMTAARLSSGESEENFDMITDQEIMQSMHESIIENDPRLCSAGMVTVQQLEDGELSDPPELWVGPGRVYAVPVLIDESGVSLSWEFSTQPKDIGFGVTYRETSVSGPEEQEVLIETIRCNSHKRPVQGDLIARKTGVYTLLFDNTHSRFTSKQLTYKLEATSVLEHEAPPDDEGRHDAANLEQKLS